MLLFTSSCRKRISSVKIPICSDRGRLIIEPTSLANAELMRNYRENLLAVTDTERGVG